MGKSLGINTKELYNEMVKRGPEIIQILGNEIKTSLDKNKRKYFNEFSHELETNTNLSTTRDSVDIRTNAIGKAYDNAQWDDPEVKAEMRSRKESGYYRKYAKARRGIRSGMIHGKKHIPFITNAVWSGGKKMSRKVNNAGK